MASSFTSKRLLLRSLYRATIHHQPPYLLDSSTRPLALIGSRSRSSRTISTAAALVNSEVLKALRHPSIVRSFCTRNLSIDEDHGPAPIDYGSMVQEDEFHKLADETIQNLLEKFEEYGDDIQLDGFDIDYGNQVLTLKLGDLGTYVINKQAPNRQIWLSSPVSRDKNSSRDAAPEPLVHLHPIGDSPHATPGRPGIGPTTGIYNDSNKDGPSRFDWDRMSKAWIYRRSKANLLLLLEEEVAKLCGEPINLS
ncbi:hypothetical protein QJS04_geneDACA021957 [Acorus gramineus]|uniref:Ferroxidase n=1 Tax=Acorus gramineus TaxID=55184 RepID=A0AAV9AA41_ACOGR|nr:hypothetical protein QJS04_geneDACA021957 [Acorus gramineus]